MPSRRDLRKEQTAIGQEVKRLRLAKDWNLKALADRARITTTTLRGCEWGTKHTQPDKLAKIAKALGTTVAHLTQVEPKDLRTKDLQDEDYQVAQWFHHAPRPVKNWVWALHQQGKEIAAVFTDPLYMELLTGWPALKDKQKEFLLMQYRFILSNPDVDRGDHRSETRTGGVADGFPSVHPKIRSPHR